MNDTSEQVREQFEAWWKSARVDMSPAELERAGSGYAVWPVEYAYQAYLAGRESAAPPAASQPPAPAPSVESTPDDATLREKAKEAADLLETFVLAKESVCGDPLNPVTQRHKDIWLPKTERGHELIAELREVIAEDRKERRT